MLLIFLPVPMRIVDDKTSWLMLWLCINDQKKKKFCLSIEPSIDQKPKTEHVDSVDVLLSKFNKKRIAYR